MELFGNIYIVRNNINDKVYIGKTINSIQHRFQEHINTCLTDNYNNRTLYLAMKKYGINQFYVELIEQVPIELLSEKEQYWINYYDSYINGYNATKGGDGSILYNYQDILNKFQQGSLVHELAEEFECDRQTIRRALDSGGVNSRINEQQRKSRKVCCLDKNGNTVNYFDSLSDAGRWIIKEQEKTTELKNIVANISRAVNGKRKTAYGYIWQEDEMNYQRQICF